MTDSHEKGNVRADISDDVIQEALRSVERRTDKPATEVDPTSGSPTDPAETAALRAENDSLKAQIEFSQAKSRELMEKLREDHERALRAAADLDNFKKRAAKEKEEVQKFGVERLLRDFLPVIDNLDRALEQPLGAESESFRAGVAMTRKLFEDSLAKHGVKGFSAKGKLFDPHLHEAMGQAETTAVPVNHVAQELLCGYTLHDRLIRPALVMVAKAPAAPVASPQSAPASEAPAQPEVPSNSEQNQ